MLERFFGSKSKNGQRSAGNGAADTDYLIQLNDIVKTFDTDAGPLTVLKNINLQFDKGEFVGVIGKSGSGKSTLINMVTGIDRPTSGEVYVGGTPVHTLSEGKMAVWRGKNMGIVFQFFQLLPTLTLLENVMLPMDFVGMYSPSKRKERARELLGMVDLEDQVDKLPSAVSGGQQQRAAIARALANDPPILVADEPTGNLDSQTAETIFQMFERLVDEGKTILMVTHDEDLAKRVTRTVLLADGTVVNEYVAKALPVLSHDQMLQATRDLEPEHHQAGETIIEEGAPADKFYIITKGEVEVALKRPGGADVVVTRMGQGQYFGEIELMRGGNNIATIRAAPEGPVDTIVLERHEFLDLVSESEAARRELERIIEARIAENRAGREGEI